VIASLKLGEFSSGAMAKSTMQSLMGFVGYNVIFGVISGTTDNACHAGGLLAGLALGALIAKVAPEERLMPRIGVLVLAAAVLGGGMYALERSRAYPYYLMRASEQIADGKTAAAIPFYEAALKLRPGSDELHYQLGRVYWEQKDLAGAERELQKVLELAPKDEGVLSDLGGVRLEQHRLPEARKSYEQLLAINPQSADGHLGLGTVASAEGNCGLALREYAQAEQLNPRLGDLYARQGACLLKEKQYDAAIAAFRKEIAVSGDDAASERALAEAYQSKGMTPEADAARQQAEKLKAKSE
jgi:tetratricopeptide (TPR) repeat protein